MSQLSNKEKTLLYILAVAIVMVVGVKFMLLPSLESYKALQNELETAKQQEAIINQKLSEVEAFDNKIEEVITQVEEASRPFYPNAPKEMIQQWIVGEAKKNNIQITALTVSDPTATAVVPYQVASTISKYDYPIGNYYDSILQSLGSNETVEQTQNGEVVAPNAQEGDDQVLKTSLSLTMTTTQMNLLQFIDGLETMNRHIILENVPLENFNRDESRTVSMTISLYSIDKTGDQVFGTYTF